MKKQDLKVLPVDGGYKGYSLYNGEVVFESKTCSSLTEAANEVKKAMKENSSLTTGSATEKTITNHSYASQVDSQGRSTVVRPGASGKCCGRG